MVSVKLALCGAFIRLLQVLLSSTILFLDPYVLLLYDDDISFRVILLCAFISTTYLITCFVLSLYRPTYLITGAIQVMEVLQAVYWLSIFLHTVIWRIHFDKCGTQYYAFYEQQYYDLPFGHIAACFLSRFMVTFACLCFLLFSLSGILFGWLVVWPDIKQGQQKALWLLKDNTRYWLMWLCFARDPLNVDFQAVSNKDQEKPKIELV